VIEELVPKHLMLELVRHVLEVLLQVLEGVFIVSDLGVGIVVVVEHHGFHREAEVELDFAQCLLVVDENISDNVLLVIVIVDSDVHYLLPEVVIESLLVGLLHFEALDAVVLVVLDDWLQVVDAFGGQP